ncbi:hypothetical protein COE25_07105 [Bacillus sp. AFS031507]|nr:hypothetical protein COE25_07105 [Bacillus sp. AFS031507]
MKRISIFFLIFSLVITLAILMDLLQGLGFYEALYGFIKMKQKLTGEDIVVIFFSSFLSLFQSPTIFLKITKRPKPILISPYF